MEIADSAEFRNFWATLVSAARANGVPAAAAEDLCGDAILKGLESFDGERGDFRGFCHAILGNKVKNYWRTCRRLVGLEEEPADETGNPFEREDEMRSISENLNLLGILLPPDEAGFLRTLLRVVEETDDACISEAARRLNMTPAKGWDLFRKIQRRAARRGSAARFSIEAMAKEPENACRVLSSPSLEYMSSVPRRLPDLGFDAFVTRIGPERVREITLLLHKEGS